jgi:hypothetical protein
MSDSVVIARAPLRARLREKLPEILIEAASIVLALLLAQSIGVWHEARQHEELAAQARTAILAEMRENVTELDKLRTQTKSVIENLKAAAAVSTAPPASALSVSMALALLSEAAWRASLATGSIQYGDYRWTMRVAKVYELQGLVLHAQSVAVDQLTDISNASKESPRELALRLLSRQSALAELAEGLGKTYHDVLDEAP